MKLLHWLPSLFLAATVFADAEAPTELQIETTFKPDDCTVTAGKGDQIQVHYVRH